MERPIHAEDVLYRAFEAAGGKKPSAVLAGAMMGGVIEKPGGPTAWDLPIKQWEGRSQNTTNY
eukprot:2469483-Pyramimonas_sp.AAC.1